MVRLAKITKNCLGAPVWAHILYFSLCQVKVKFTFVFFLFYIRLVELVELGELN